MRLRKDEWFRMIRTALLQRGFEPTSGACPGLCSPFDHRNGVRIEIRGGRMLRILQKGRAEKELRNLSLEAALEAIEQAVRGN